MSSKIILSKNGVDKRCELWAKKIMKSLKNFIKDVRFHEIPIKKTVNTIFCLNNSDFNEASSDLKSKARLVEPDQNFYSKIAKLNLTDTEILEAYTKLPTVEDNRSFAFWLRSNYKCKILNKYNILPHEGYIFMNGPKIISGVKELDFSLIEMGTMIPEFLFFKVILLHEFCHHCSYINLRKESFRDLQKDQDHNFTEALANYFVSTFWPGPVSQLLAELAITQPTSYSLYNYLRLVDKAIISKIFSNIYKRNNIIKTLREFAHALGAKVIYGGGSFFVSDYNGIVFDWEKSGENIYCYEKIIAIASLSKGVVISPNIDCLIGRYPPDTIIISNNITNIIDYDRNKLPDNIKILDKKQLDIASIMKPMREIQDSDERRKQIHATFGLKLETL